MSDTNNKLKTAIILAAGRGNKMWPFNEYWPKAALPAAGKPNINRWLELLLELGFERILIAAGYLDQRIRYLVEPKPEIELITVSSSNGTADTLEQVLGHVTDDDVLVVYGDVVVTRAGIEGLVTQYRQSTPDTLVLAQPFEGERSQDWMCANMDGDRVMQIYAHPRPHYVNHQLFGVVASQTKALRSALNRNPGFMVNVNVGMMPPMESQLEQSLQMMIDAGLDVRAFSVTNSVVDMDKPWHIMEAAHLILQDEVSTLQASRIPDTVTIDPSAQIRGHVILGENVVIGRNVLIQGNAVIGDETVIDNGAIIGANVVIGKSCRISDYCKIGSMSVVGNHNRIGHCAEFEGVTFDSVSFTHYGEVYGVVGSGTDIAAGVTVGILRFDDLNQVQKIAGRMETPKRFGNAVYFGDYTRTGIASLYMPGVKVGCNSVIGASVMIESDLPSRSLVYVEQQLVRKEWNPKRYGW
jgi:NDP-sugar pyrophosphorylase family protein